MNNDERDDLWQLLGHCREPRISPFFSRHILRRIRSEERSSVGFLTWMLRRWPIVVAAACVAIFAGVALLPRTEQPISVEAMAENVGASPDYAVIGNLDELLAAEESSVWLTHSVD